MITNVYVDGFNLYYRALKDTPFRWLDLHKLAATLFPDDTIRGVHYFTARLDARRGNPGKLSGSSSTFERCRRCRCIQLARRASLQ